MDAGATEEKTGFFAEDSGPDIVEGVGVGEGEHLLADVFGGGFKGSMIVFRPRHPGEEMTLARFGDRCEDFFRIGELVGADDESVGLELAIQRGWRGPG